MKVKFIVKPWKLRLHYHLNDIADLPENQANEVISLGYAIPIEMDLPIIQEKAEKAKNVSKHNK
jgi:hypothetical protein